jgi:hypothetical protein
MAVPNNSFIVVVEVEGGWRMFGDRYLEEFRIR